MRAASAVPTPIVSGDFGRWERILRHSESNQLDILQTMIEKTLRNDSSCSDPAYTAQRAALALSENIQKHKAILEKSKKETIPEMLQNLSQITKFATAMDTLLQIAKKMDKERDKKCEKIDGEHKELKEKLKNLQVRTETAQKNIQSEIDALQEKSSDPSIDATQKAVAQERISKLQDLNLQGQIKTIHDEIGKVTQEPFKKLSDQIVTLDKQKNPVLFKGELAETQVAMRDSENAYKEAQKFILNINTTNERLNKAVMPFFKNEVADIFRNAAKKIAIPEAQKALQTLAIMTNQVQEQCKTLITLGSKMITKESQELYRTEYQNTADQMNKSLTEIATQIKSRYNTFIHACAQDDKESLANAFNILRELDDAAESAKLTTTENRPRVANPAADSHTISAEDLGRGFEIYHYQRTNEYDKTSPLEKTYAKDKNGDHLNLSITEIEQVVAAINKERTKDGKKLLDLKIKNKGDNRYSFTMNCHDEKTKKNVIDKMVAMQNKRVEVLAQQNKAGVATANLANATAAATGVPPATTGAPPASATREVATSM